MPTVENLMQLFHLTPVVIAAATVVAFALAAALVWTGSRLLRRSIDRLELASAEDRAAVQARSRELLAALKLIAFGIAALASLSLALAAAGVALPAWRPRQLLIWAVSHGMRVGVIVGAAYMTIRASHLAIEHLQYKIVPGGGRGDLEWRRRATTLGSIGANLVSAVVAFMAGLMVLRELSIDVLPILTGAGIAGLAIGFGAQNLVRDVISGFFMILENQIRVGDLARVNGVGGMVEQMNLRTIVLRDAQGAVHVFPNGAITALANLSKDFSYAIVDIAVAHTENLDWVFGTLYEIGATMQRDPATAPLLLAPIEVLGLEALGETSDTIRVRFKTVALRHDDIARELRRRIVALFTSRPQKAALATVPPPKAEQP